MTKPPASRHNELDSDAKRRIMQEETYRLELRRKLERGDKAVRGEGRSARILRFLNTSLGLWLLSTLVVSGLGTAYTLVRQKWENERLVREEERQQARNRVDQVHRLDLEIGFRLSNLLSLLHEAHLEQSRPNGPGLPSRQIEALDIEQFVRLSPRDATNYRLTSHSLYRAYHSHPLPSLLAELSRLDGARDPLIARSLSTLTSMPALFERRHLLAAPDNARVVAAAIHQEVLLPRWRQNQFAYMRCDASEPFC